MSFEPVGDVAARILAGLSVELKHRNANGAKIAAKIGSEAHNKHLGADYERNAEQAQYLAGQQAAWERLIASGFFK